MTTINDLGVVLDFIARYCQRGLLSLINQAPKPSWAILADGVEYLTSHKGEFIPSLEITAINLAYVEEALEMVPWENIVAAVDVYSKNPETERDWAIYKAYALYGMGKHKRNRGGRSVITAIADRVGKDYRTIRGIIQRVPREIAKIAINGPALYETLDDILSK